MDWMILGLRVLHEQRFHLRVQALQPLIESEDAGGQLVGHRGLGERGSLRRSPANTSTGVGTLVNPSVATVTACATKSKIKKEPFFEDCRWKTQNVVVEGNAFTIDPSKIPCCKPSKGCGFNGVFSNYGTYPPGRPTREKSCKRTSLSSRTTCGGTTPTSGNWHFMVEAPDMWSRGTRGDRRRTIRTSAAA